MEAIPFMQQLCCVNSKVRREHVSEGDGDVGHRGLLAVGIHWLCPLVNARMTGHKSAIASRNATPPTIQSGLRVWLLRLSSSRG